MSQCDRTVRILVVTLLALALAACAPDAPPAEPPVPVDGCAALGAGALVIAGIESAPGYDEELAALDLPALPPSISLAALAAFEKDLVLYMLDEPALDAVDRDRALTTPLGRAVLASFAKAAAAGAIAGIDVGFLRRGLHRFYACGRGFPLTLAEFNATVVDVSAMVVGETVDSRVKGLPRRMRRSVVDGAFVAETLVATPEGERVRETEILLTDRRNDGAIEFIEYDAAGDLRSASSFASSTGAQSVGAVPFTCMACHGTRDVTPASP